jgi:hypothetical protein
VTVFDERRWVPADLVVHDPSFRHPSPAMFAHLKSVVGEEKANELAENVTMLTIALFDTLGDRRISVDTAQHLLALAALTVADEYLADAAALES